MISLYTFKELNAEGKSAVENLKDTTPTNATNLLAFIIYKIKIIEILSDKSKHSRLQSIQY
jgi:hypothetical protein